MSIESLKAKALRHWKEWLPESVKEWEKDGTLNQRLTGAANLAQTEIDHLVNQANYQPHEAEEVALHRYILLKPETPGGLTKDEQREVEEKEREYQRNLPVPLAEEEAT